jgi:hypothetical protein
MSVDFDRAVAFVRAHGGEFDQVRLDQLLGDDVLLSGEQETRFLAGQRADGGWPPPWAREYSSLDATCFRLAQGEGLALGFLTPAFARAADFLCARQREDGSWEEDETVQDLAPPWVKPGALDARLYLTANCGWWLANASLRSSFVTADEASQRAGTYLDRYLTSDAELPSFAQAQWLAAGLFIRLGWEDTARRVLDRFAARLDDELPAASLSWMLTTLGGLGFPPEHPIALRAAALLEAQQRTDGSWEGEVSPEGDPYVTAEVLRGLVIWATF